MLNNDNPTPKRPRGKPRGTRKENPRSVIMKVALTVGELATIDEHAALAGEKPSAYVRTAALARTRSNNPSQDEQEGTE